MIVHNLAIILFKSEPMSGHYSGWLLKPNNTCRLNDVLMCYNVMCIYCSLIIHVFILKFIKFNNLITSLISGLSGRVPA